MIVSAESLFPERTLFDSEGRAVPLASRWESGLALFLLGHRDCKTTRELLPHVDRVHRRCGAGASVVAVLQDSPGTAAGLKARLALELPVLLDAAPYPLASDLALEVVPTLFLVERGGRIAATSEAFRRADLESFAARLGVEGPLFASDENVPAFRPG